MDLRIWSLPERFTNDPGTEVWRGNCKKIDKKIFRFGVYMENQPKRAIILWTFGKYYIIILSDNTI